MLHQAVAGHLRDDRGCGNRRHDAVAAHYRLHHAIERQAVAAVDENITWPARERIHGTGERPQARPQDIVAVDARRRRDANRDLSGRRDLLEEDVALFGIEHFGIIKALRCARGIEDHRRRHDRPGPWAPARFVASGDRREPEAILPRLAGEGRATARRRFFVLDHGAGFRNSVIDLTYLYFSFFRGQSRDCKEPTGPPQLLQLLSGFGRFRPGEKRCNTTISGVAIISKTAAATRPRSAFPACPRAASALAG